ncbi:MAG: RNA polymerase sigma factor [Gemmataceae bacterium]
MAGNHLSKVLERLRHVVGKEPLPASSDGELLKRFVGMRDETAFASIVERHGPMVLGVCRRALSNPHDAEDAFQATFLLLVRKAGSLRDPELLGNWLYGVACRIARRAQATSSRRRSLQAEEIPDMATSQALTEAVSSDLRLVLDEELEKLPRKYRAPMVLCYLQGETNETAARKLRWAIGTLKTRLSRARDLLRDRLALRGLALSTGALAAALTPQTASAAVPATLAEATVQEALRCMSGATITSTSVAALTEGAYRELQNARLRLVAGVLVAVSVVAGGASALAYHVWQPAPALEDGGLAQQVNQRVLDWQPTQRERRFDEIGWAPSLAEARRRARELDRPILVIASTGRINTGRDAASATNLRASAFSNDAIIDFVNHSYVPVYLSGLDRNAELERIRATAPTLAPIFSASEAFILDPDGRPLQAVEACHSCSPAGLGEVLNWFARERGDELAFAPTKQSRRPAASADALVIHLVSRYLKRVEGKLVPLDDPLGVSVNYFSRGLPAEDWLVLERSQWAGFWPAQPLDVGGTWEIGPETSALLYRYCYPPTEVNEVTRSRIDASKLTGTVVARSGNLVRARLDGNLTMKHRFAPERDDNKLVVATFQGYIDFDVASGRVQSLQLHSVEGRYGKREFGVALRLVP